MLEALLPLILILLGFYLWQSALKAREQARAISHELCARARVQLLDQTVALQRRFELSIDGVDRHQGTLEVLDGVLLSHSMPLPAGEGPAPIPATNVIELRPPSRVH